MTRHTAFNVLLCLGGFLSLGAAEDIIHSGCSTHKYLTCAENANCTDIGETGFKCECYEGFEGDGLREGSGCSGKPCRGDNECHINAICNGGHVCECKIGFKGVPRVECYDIDECLEPNMCHRHATCNNTVGSYVCMCKSRENYIGNGTYCVHQCYADTECDRATEYCDQVTQTCLCKPGFRETVDGCQNINECYEETDMCDQHATCTDTEGSYDCTCKNGFDGDGRSCTRLPLNCDEILKQNPNARTTEYTIDPDGEGELGPITVTCQMRTGLGITVLEVTWKRFKFEQYTQLVRYKYKQSLEEIKAVIGTSGFCYQEMSNKCFGGGNTLSEGDYWIDGNGAHVYSWGGSGVDNMCLCGRFNICAEEGANCNCNGGPDTLNDAGKIISKEILPIRGMNKSPQTGSVVIKISDLFCASKPFDIPLDCDDAKTNFKVKNDGPQLLDFDGADGPLEPVYAFCDMKSCNNVGVTVISHDRAGANTPSEPGAFDLTYHTTQAHVKKLIEVSHSCSQYAEYECTNSRLLNHDGQMMGYVSSSGRDLSYWPGGMQLENMCGCGILGQCENKNEGCNCAIKDGKTRKDFGIIKDKNDLPITAVTVKEIDGSASKGSYRIGALRCSRMECGILATCQSYAEAGHTESYTYLIDPDGPGFEMDNQPAFPAYCQMESDPLYGVTRIHHINEKIISVLTSLSIQYLWVNNEQLSALVTRASSCIQTAKYTCKNAPLHDDGKSMLEWISREGEPLSYLHGDGDADSACLCGLDDACDGGGKCNCDMADGTERSDTWTYTNKEYLPVQKLIVEKLNSSSQGFIELGPMECRELQPTCSHLKAFKYDFRLITEYIMEDDDYVIDPDGQFGVKPFTVKCEGTRTILPSGVDDGSSPTDGKPDDGVSKCYPISYFSPNNSPVSKEQVQALVTKSRFCGQQISQECLNAPLTGHSTYTTCDGVQQTGWGGSHGEDQCACGVLGTCAGGPEAKCNCDLEDGVKREDGGWVVGQDLLAICEVCVSLNSTSSLDISPKTRTVLPSVSHLFCDRFQIGVGTTCQDWSEKGSTESGPVLVDIDGRGPTKLFPLFCTFEISPPLGISETIPETPEKEVPENGTVIIEYYEYEIELTVELVKRSRYCTQELTLLCENAFVLVNGTLQQFWEMSDQDMSACEDGMCPCNGVVSGILNDTSQLPVREIELGQSSGNRTITLGSLKCFDLYRTCDEIKQAKANTNPFGNDIYTIDPDQGGEVPYFAVTCDFKTDRNIGITQIPVTKPSDRTVKNQNEPGSLVVDIDYGQVTPIQIHTLAQISSFCIQYVQYTCINSPLINSNSPMYSYVTTYGGGVSTSFGVAGHSDTVGCACMATNTCPSDSSCHCDARGKMTVDYGFETDRAELPITSFSMGGQRQGSSAVYDFSGVECGPTIFDLPENCQKVFELGKRSGEHLIWPTGLVEPFLVYCDMEIVVGKGVTVVRNDIEIEKIVTFGEIIDVTYYDADREQIDALVESSKYCYQGFHYTCQSTKMLGGEGYFYWQGGDSGQVEEYTGGGRYFARECHCGSQGKCGGSEDRDILINLNRKCNCDAADNETRADAGIFQDKDKLPVKAMMFEPTGTSNPYGAVRLGQLMCAEEKFDIDECKEGFNDCHEKADCINTDGSYECICKPGWRGKGRPDKLANGRNCYNDDECAKTLNYCPLHAICTDTPGSYECECEEGFRPKGNAKQKCLDINECEENIHNCDENADCYNTPGSFVCRCRRNFRGDGTFCKPLAQCAVFGDPHVLTFDTTWYSFQGTCEYILSKDNCGVENAEPTYELTSSFYRKYPDASKDASWVKSVKLEIYGHVIELMQGNEVRVNGLRINPTYILPDKFKILRFGGRVEVLTDMGLEVTWDGNDAVELYVPGDFFNNTCGMCGSYNGDKTDDFMVGPQCAAEEGTITDNVSLFGTSWVDPDDEVCTANCSTPEETECPPEKKAIAELQCRRIYGQHKVFKECLDKMDENNEYLKRVYYQICVYDMCRVTGDAELGLCSHAKHLLEACSTLVDVEIESFRTEDFCPPDCQENMDYNSCMKTSILTCYDYLTGSEPSASAISACQDGCFCKEGYVADGDSCVLPEDCGCLHEDQYYKKGEVINLNNCSEQIKCEGDDRISEPQQKQCHIDAVCEIKNGIYGCHCKDGLYGDGITVCVEDPCLPNPCGGNETCIHNLELSQYYECDCNPGFMGDCGNCTEIDECKTELNSCPQHSNCINTVGSFKCECRDGFVMSGNQCLDVDECQLAELKDENLCGENAKCVNKIGTFKCLCCTGFKKDSNGDCVASNPNAPGEKCCYCYGPKCKEQGKVCGTDHKTYSSRKELEIKRCLEDDHHLTVDYFGKCKARCTDSLCPKWQECEINDSTGKPTCVCSPCTDSDRNSGRVCTSKFDVFETKCNFMMAMCKMDTQDTIFNNMQTCEDHWGEFPVGPWSSWTPCSVTCGPGTQTRGRSGNVTEEFKEKYPLIVEKDCYAEPCEGPCKDNDMCSNVSAECVVNEDGDAECECPTCENVEDDPVCGYVIVQNKQPNLRSFSSACSLQKDACNRGLDHVVYDIENCHVEPVVCTTIPELRFVTGGDNDEYISPIKIDLPKCGGGCGTDKSLCCQPSETETIAVDLRNTTMSPTSFQLDIEKIKKCECRPLVP